MLHNVRQKLTIITAVLFVCAIVVSVVSPKEIKNTEAEAVKETSAKADIAADGLFNGDEKRFVAHRGYSAAAPENTALAFELAGKSGFWGIETDISETLDGEMICMHDDTVDRTTDGNGEVGEYTFAILRSLSVMEGANVDKYPYLTIPTMREYLDICTEYGCVPIIEIKKISDYDKFLDIIYEYGVQDKCVVTGGIPDLLEIRKRDEDIILMVIGYSNIGYEEYLEKMAPLTGDIGILYNYPVVDEEVIEVFRSKGMYIGVWSLDTVEDAEKYLSYGVDYVVTNVIPGSTDYMVNTTE